MSKRHKHHIDVQTDEELVTVTIGSDGGIPGGFAKLFNRVVDSQAWARLPDAARAVYVPLVRFADHRNQFQVQVGRAGLMKYTGLSQSSIKRAIKDLMAHKLVALIEQGGVSASGENESNVYQLLVPAEGRKGAMPASSGGSTLTPQGVRKRTPSPATIEPPAGAAVTRPEVPARPPLGVQVDAGRGVGGGPQLRTLDKESSKTAGPGAPSRLSSSPPSPADRAAALLEEKGVEAAVARQLAHAYPYERVIDVIATMEWRRARGKCANPGGFIRDALVKQWQVPKAVVDARARADAQLKAEAAVQTSRAAVHREQAQVGAEEARINRLIDALDDDELAILSGSVLEKYQGNAAVTRVLMAKPARECRLMKMEIAGMLGTGARG